MTGVVLNRFLEPLAECFTSEVADRIVRLRTDPAVQQRIDELATKANEGQLTADESAEYEEFVEGIDLLGIVKAKARTRLLRKD